MPSQYVTPTLFVGEPAPWPHAQPTNQPDEAVSIVRNGGVVVLPEGAWETADRVLEMLGVAQSERDRLISFARYRRLPAGSTTATRRPAESKASAEGHQLEQTPNELGLCP